MVKRKLNLWTLELVCRKLLSGNRRYVSCKYIVEEYNVLCPPDCRVHYISGSSLRRALVGLPGSVCFRGDGKLAGIVREDHSSVVVSHGKAVPF